MKRLALLLFSSLCIGVGINLFLHPIRLINGGMFGISLIINYVWGLKIGHMLIILNVPIYLISLFYDKSYFFQAILGLAVTSSMIDLLAPISGLIHLPFLISASFGGIIIGVGIGCMLRKHISPGGIDLLALLISKTTGMNPGIIIFAADFLIIMAGVFILKDIRLIYSIIPVFFIGLSISILNMFKSIHFY